MIIRKTQQPADYPANSIHDSFNTDINGTYNCRYINGIVESGSNSDGSWTKWADGTMICCKKINYSGNFGTAWGSFYETAVIDFGNFAQEFTEIPTVTFSCGSGAFAGIEGFPNRSTIKIGQTNLYRPVSGGATVEINMIAVGKWK